jgi:uncharacterized membrane protein
MSEPSGFLMPLRKTVTVPWPPDRAFARFTAELGSWWPLRSHSGGGARAERCVFEERLGGRIYEELGDGTRHVWGTATVWEPPTRTVFSWHPGREPDTAQSVEVRFVPDGTGTRLELTHSGWERLGSLARTARRGYPLGWSYVLNIWAGRPHRPVNLFLDGVMRFLAIPTRVWLWLAGLLLVINVLGAWIAYGRAEMLHASVCLALAVLAGLSALWLWKRLTAATTSPPVPAARR